MQKIRKINWKDFEDTSENYQSDFENLCRLFFKIHFLHDISIILTKTTNNPGIETNPIGVNGTRIGFQAKYFGGNIDYTDIFNSAEKTVKHYLGKIDKVVVFCNKDINEKATKYVKAKELLNRNSIEIESFCNDNLLDIINMMPGYERIKALYFNRLGVSNKWFSEQLNKELKSLSPRYVQGFHVTDDDIEGYFDVIYRSDSFFKKLSLMVFEWKKECESLQISKSIKSQIEKKISRLEIPETDHILDVFHWFDNFIDENDQLKAIIKSKESEIESAYANGKDEQFVRRIMESLRNYSNALGLIDKINLSKEKYIQYLDKKVIILEGDAGIGKSHLLGYEAETHSKSNKTRSILMLGQKLVFNTEPESQILNYLGIEDSTFDEFLDACEAKGEIDNNLTVIIIDAINECSHYKAWKNYFSDLIEKVQQKRYIRLVVSIRSTYKDFLFSEQVFNQIKDGQIGVIRHKGFESVLADAIPAFFNEYNIPITTSAYLEEEFKNPLFLMTYCKGYNSHNANFGSEHLYKWYISFIKNEEVKIKEKNEILSAYPFAETILNIIGDYFFEHNTRSISYVELLEKTNNIQDAREFIDGFLRAKALVSYLDHDGKEHVYINYEKFSDFIVAKALIDKSINRDMLFSRVKEVLLVVDQYGRLKNYTAVGVFAALSILVKERYGCEIIDCIQCLPEKDKYDNYLRNDLVNEYIYAYKYRKDSDVDAVSYSKHIAPYILTEENLHKHLDLLISMVGRNNELNAKYLAQWLQKMSLAKRDYRWTIYINSQFEKGCRIYNIIQTFLNEGISVNSEEKELYSKFVVCLFTSSNRILRDKASRALIKLLDNDIALMMDLIDGFIGYNDSYVVSRLFGCIYGALLRVEDSRISKAEVRALSKKVYEGIFNKEHVYPDILLRDYALNIIEYSQYLGIALEFDINTCRPPYKSKAIIGISIEQLKQLYPNVDYTISNKWLGTSAIKSSMAPEYGLRGFTGMYGDFGRYVFGRSLRNFKDLNYDAVYSYAYGYIVKNLGYDNELFSYYDKNVGYGRMRKVNSIERIGKKYEWIAMYHTLALVADQYKYEEKYSDEKFMSYKGSWRPYVRDFDPTLMLNSNDDKMESGIILSRKEFNSWNFDNKNWADNEDGMFDFKQLIAIKDNNNDDWVALRFAITDKSYVKYEQPNQSIWKSATACLIKVEEKDYFISKIKDKSFWGRWLEAAEVGDEYTVFCREYCWAPAYKDTYKKFSFEDVEIETGKRTVRKKIKDTIYAQLPKEVLKLFDGSDDNNVVLQSVLSGNKAALKNEYEELESVYETIGRIAPLYNSFLWEEQYDFGKDDTISILMPSKILVIKLGLEQEQDGFWYKDGKLACADFSFVKGSNLDGLYIRKEILDAFLTKMSCDIVWIGMGEKNHIYDSSNTNNIFSNISALVYKNKDGKYLEINHVSKR